MIIVALMQESTHPVYIPIYTQKTLAPVVARSMYHSIIKKCWAKWFESVNQYPFNTTRTDNTYSQHEYKFVHRCNTSVFIPRLFGVSSSDDSRPVMSVLTSGMWQVLGANALAATIPGMLMYLRNQYHDREVKPIVPGGFLADFYLGVGGGSGQDQGSTSTPNWLSFIDEYLTMYDNWPMAPVLNPVQVIFNSVKAEALWMLMPDSDAAFVYNYLPRSIIGMTGSLEYCLYEKYADKAKNVAYQWYLSSTYELD